MDTSTLFIWIHEENLVYNAESCWPAHICQICTTLSDKDFIVEIQINRWRVILPPFLLTAPVFAPKPIRSTGFALSHIRSPFLDTLIRENMGNVILWCFFYSKYFYLSFFFFFFYSSFFYLEKKSANHK